MGLTKADIKSVKLPGGVELYCQTYERQNLPDGVQVAKTNIFYDDQGGWFKENLRLDENGHVLDFKNLGVTFRPIQANTSWIAPMSKRFWHLHPSQNEIWSTNSTILVGLIDLREESPTYMAKTKIILTPERLLYIPSRVAHGFINPNNFHVTLNYFVDCHFSPDEKTQECRIDPKDLPFDFVESEIM